MNKQVHCTLNKPLGRIIKVANSRNPERNSYCRYIFCYQWAPRGLFSFTPIRFEQGSLQYWSGFTFTYTLGGFRPAFHLQRHTIVKIVFFRLTPVCTVIMGFIATFLIYLGAGPYRQNIRDLSTGCRLCNSHFKSELLLNVTYR